MTKEDLQKQFKEAIRINKYGMDEEYLNQLELEIVDIVKNENGELFVDYKIHNFNYNEIHENGTSGSDSFGFALYHSLYLDSDLMKKDPQVAKFIELAEKEAGEIAEKSRKKNRSWFYKIFPFLESERGYMGMCHSIWHEQKKILKDKYNIDWKSPQDRLPYAKFD